MKRYAAVYLGCIILVQVTKAQISTTPVTPSNAVNQVLLGTGVTGGNISFQGNPMQLASFSDPSAAIGFSSGLIISTGNAANPLLNGPVGNFCSDGTGSGSHPLLQAISSVTINDAAVLQFDFVPQGDTLSFDYVFGSEEYNEFANTGFNDAFGFFLTGPNPQGGNYSDFNVALIPGTSTPVTINNVNNGNWFGCANGPCMNCQYFVDNCNGTAIAVDAYTTVLKARALVVPCATYTIKLAIGDGGDAAFDSWVFLKANSFVTPQLLLSSNVNIGGVDTVMYEGCSHAWIKLFRNYNLNESKTFNLQLSGTAQNGVDFSGIPPSITLQPGQTTDSVNVVALFNGAFQGNTTLTISVVDTVCPNGGTVSSSITLTFVQVDPLQVSVGPDLFVCDTVNITPLISGGVQPYQYNWNSGLFTGPQIVNNVIHSDTSYTLVVTDVCGTSASDMTWVDKILPPTVGFDISIVGTPLGNESCTPLKAQITRTNFINQSAVYPLYISGTATNGTDYQPLSSVGFSAGQTTAFVDILPVLDGVWEPTETIILKTIDTLCNGSFVLDSVIFYLYNVEPLVLDAGPDQETGCPHGAISIQPSLSGGLTPYQYLWSSGETTLNITSFPQDTTLLTLTVTDSCGKMVSDQIQLNVYFPPLADFVATSQDWCQPSLVTFTNTSQAISGQITEYRWNFAGLDSALNITHPTFVFHASDTFHIQLIATNSKNCRDTVVKSIVVHPKPLAHFTYMPSDPSLLNPKVTLVNLSSSDVTSWDWYVEQEYISSQTNSEYVFQDHGYFDVVLVVTNGFGCKDTAYQEIFVQDDVAFYIPNSFTPDGDNLNEVFKVHGKNIQTFNMVIFDRWGQKIFESTDPETGWTGRRNNGLPYKQDTYVYKVYILDTFGREYVLRGHVTLLGTR
ncbi:MAG: choice-of-anchor L domain-containing protein [Flavobacteriales bacterium]|nr:choice-of-anchor L domain-containing protein [Flavobacteriales bacterium]MDW8431086.1 choice-of-anchor L domain-containing protein [Flavobacteriales bacterium]